MARKTKAGRTRIPQLNIRSAFAVQRARQLARKAGLTTTKVVEDALRSYEIRSPVEGKLRWEAELDDIVRRANEGQPPLDWRAVEDGMYDELGNAR